MKLALKESNRIQSSWVRERINTDITPPTCLVVTSHLLALPDPLLYFGFSSTDTPSLYSDNLIGFDVGKMCNMRMAGENSHQHEAKPDVFLLSLASVF
jgi:hypothetical protein